MADDVADGFGGRGLAEDTAHEGAGEAPIAVDFALQPLNPGGERSQIGRGRSGFCALKRFGGGCGCGDDLGGLTRFGRWCSTGVWGRFGGFGLFACRLRHPFLAF